ncbi:MAG TPA: MarC family protein [Armatimonadota bacterium]|nr:MarC family protein [Armatimonadota bacterium]
MPETLVQIATASAALFVIIDPIGGLPVIMGLLQPMAPEDRRRSLDISILVSLAILLGFAAAGVWLLGVFGVGLSELLLAGGLVLVVVGMDVLFGFLPPASCSVEDACIIPIASPLLAGPGAITTVMLTMHKLPGPRSYLVAGVSVVLALAVSWVILRQGERLLALLGRRGSLVIAKLMGIVILAIGVSFALRGITGYLTSIGIITG